MRLLTLLLSVFIVSSAFAQPQSFLSGERVNIDAEKTVDICSGTGAVTIATNCTGGGTTKKWVFGNDGDLIADSTGGGQLLALSGSESSPSLSFASDTDSGFYLSSAAQPSVSASSEKIMDWTTTRTRSYKYIDIFTDDPVLNLFDGGSLRGYLQYTAALGLVLDSDAALRLRPNNTLALTLGTDLTATFAGEVKGTGTQFGWTITNTGNTACTTQCAGSGACVIGYDSGSNTFQTCTNATSDTCICTGT